MIQSIKYLALLFSMLTLMTPLFAQEMEPKETEDWSRKPEQLTFSENNNIPSDALVLFSGENTDLWRHVNSEKKVKWKLKEEALQIKPNSGSIHSIDSFGSCQLHIEWKTPEKDAKKNCKGQGCGNSGVFFMGLYEVQVLNSFENETYYNGQAGSVYKQHIPLANASKAPGAWQSYDIVFTAPVFEAKGGMLISPAYMTVIHNGVLIQNHVELKGPTVYKGHPTYRRHAERLPFLLQDHGNNVSYRNIWVRKL